MTLLVVSNLVLWIVAVCQAVVIYSLTRLIREFLSSNRVATARTGKGLSVGSPAVPFNELSLSGERVSVQAGKGVPTYLLFASAGCLVCEELLAELAAHVDECAAFNGEFVIVGVDAPPSFFSEWPSLINNPAIKILPKSPLNTHYRVPNLPHLVVVDGAGNIARYETVDSWRRVSQAINSTVPDLQAAG